MKYIGIKCPVCDQPFQAEDDVVVCPDCGAPYHRHCYEQEGKCLFSDTHNTGTVWTPPTPEPTQEHNSETACAVCGRNNAPDSLFCSQCGSPLKPQSPHTGQPYPQPGQVPHRDNPSGYQNPYQNTGYQNPGAPMPPDPKAFPYQNGFPPQSGAPSPFNPITITSDEPLEEGVTAGDVAKYVQNNSPYFLTVFFNIKKRNKSRFSFSAFLFSGGWLLYRKMYKLGAVLTSLMALLFITNTVVSLNYATPLLIQLYEQAGVSIAAYPSYEELIRVTELVYQLDAGSIFLLFTPLITVISQLGIMLYCGLNANRLYYKHSIENIRCLRTQYPMQADYDKSLQENGGVNVSLALCLLICYSIIIYLPNFLR